MTTAPTIAARRDAAVDYVAAQMAAETYALSHRADTLALTREITHARPDDPRPGYIYDLTVNEKLIDPTMPLAVDKLAWMQGLLLKTGNMKSGVDIGGIVDGSIRAAAAARIGK